MVREAFRWGDAYFRWIGDDTLSFALPLSANTDLLGGLLVERPLGGEEASPALLSVMRDLARDLGALLEKGGLLDGALRRERKAEHSRERLRAEALHEAKGGEASDLRTIYARLEPELVLAMRRGDRREARRCLNQILIAIYAFGREEVPRIKGYLLDLVAAMSRSLFDCGVDPGRALGKEFERFRELDRIEGEEELSRWLAGVLEDLIDVFATAPDQGPEARMRSVLRFLAEHCGESLPRGRVARMAGYSEAHFSRILRATTGEGFRGNLNRLRVERAVRLLRETEEPLSRIAVECGFADQSQFSRTFRARTGLTPGRFRKNEAENDKT